LLSLGTKERFGLRVRSLHPFPPPRTFAVSPLCGASLIQTAPLFFLRQFVPSPPSLLCEKDLLPLNVVAFVMWVNSSFVSYEGIPFPFPSKELYYRNSSPNAFFFLPSCLFNAKGHFFLSACGREDRYRCKSGSTPPFPFSLAGHEWFRVLLGAAFRPTGLAQNGFRLPLSFPRSRMRKIGASSFFPSFPQFGGVPFLLPERVFPPLLRS